MQTLKTCYKTSDGKLWEDKTQAKRHTAWLDLVAIVESAMAVSEEKAFESSHPEEFARELLTKRADWIKALQVDRLLSGFFAPGYRDARYT